jgi:hypothetical protein
MIDAAAVIDKWREITEVYDQRKSTDQIMYISDSELRRLDEQIKLAISLDESNVTTLLVIQKVLEDYLANRSIPLEAVVRKQEQLMLFVQLYQELWELLHAPEITQLVDHFANGVRGALVSAGFYNEQQDELLKDRYALAVLRLSALNAFKNLHVDQFSKGPNTTVGELSFVRGIYEFYDINLMLRDVQQFFADGIFLTIVRDAATDMHSFFAFVVKNGGNVWLVTDKPKWASPIQKHFPRARPQEREFSKRVAAHYFPYELLNVKWDEERDTYVIQHDSYAKALASFQDSWRTVGTIDAIEPASTLWIFMLFGLFQRRFFGEVPYLTDGLSYTPMLFDLPSNQENVRALVSVGNSLVQYQPMKMERLSFGNLTNDNPEVAAAWELKPTGQYAWAEEHYTPQISDEMLDHLLLPPGKQTVRLEIQTNQVLGTGKQEERRHIDMWNKPKSVTVPGVEMNTFGTEKEMKQWVHWHARYMKTQAIQNLMDTEFEQRKDEIRKWYEEAVRERTSILGRHIAHGVFEAEISVANQATSFDSTVSKANILSLHHAKDHIYGYHDVVIASSTSYHSPYYWCYRNGAVASIAAVFTVRDGTAIAALLGIKLDDLPIFLRNLRHLERYSGNPRLHYGDPMEELRNPWKSLNWNVRVYLSRSGYKDLCKEWGTQPQNIQPKPKD